MKLKKRSIGDMLLKRVELSKHDNAIGWPENQEIKFIDYQQYKDTIECLALALRKHGIKRADKIAILGKTNKEWHFCDMALLCSGSTVVPIYHTYPSQEIAFIINHSESKMIILEDNEQFNKVFKVLEKLKDLKQIIMLEPLSSENEKKVPTHILVHDYITLIEEGREEVLVNPDLFERLINETAETDIASIIYTSGTTGDPKGAVIQQLALSQMLLNVKKFCHQTFSAKDRSLTFLPLSHVFGRADSLMLLIFGWECVYAQSIETILEDIELVKPTIMMAVPRIFEKIYDKIHNTLEEENICKKLLYNWALNKAQTYYKVIDQDRSPATKVLLEYQLAYQLVFARIQKMFGGRIRYFISGGAPLAVEIIELLRYSNLTVLEGYGLTETVAPCTLNPFTKQKAGSVGRPIGDVQISFAPDNEILIKTQARFLEYYKNPNETQRVIDEDGWFHTGDIGEFSRDGYLIITDRKKDLIITSGGKNIAPQKIENRAKLQPHIAYCVVYGDKRNFLTAIIAIEKERFSKDFDKLGLNLDTPMEVFSKHPKVRDMIEQEVAKTNSQLARFETIKNFIILPVELTPSNYLTPSMKVRKKELFQDFRVEIDAMYQEVPLQNELKAI